MQPFNPKSQLRQIDDHTWLLGNLTLRRSTRESNAATWNDNGDGSSYIVTPVSAPTPPTSPPDSPYVALVHQIPDRSFVWAVGSDAFCKIKRKERGVTSERATLEYVRHQRPNFNVPEVLYHAEEDEWSYLFLRRMAGRTLNSAWPTLTEDWRSNYARTIVAICQEMAQWEGDRMSGVDGQNIAEYYLTKDDDFSNLERTCITLGMDCTRFVFYHADLGPTNIIVEDQPSAGTVAVIDFEIAGFFPTGWIRTKFRVSPAMSLTGTDDPQWFQIKVEEGLESIGFKDHAEAFTKWSRE